MVAFLFRKWASVMKSFKSRFGNHQGGFGIQRIIAAIFSIIELILAIRFILKLLGASASNGFVQGL
jgi:hypothetical protein